MLADDPSVSIVAQDVAYERVPAVLSELRPSVLILAAAGLRDLAEIRELSLAHPGTHLVLFSEDLAAVEQAQLLAFGASACLAWSTQARDVRNAIHLASRGLQISPRQVAEETAGRTKDPLLTPREGDVLLLLREGLANGQIALELHIGVETVRTHARHIYRKLGVASRRGLMALPATTP